MLEELASKQIMSLSVVILTTLGDKRNLDNNNSLGANSYLLWVCQPGRIIPSSPDSEVGLICEQPSIPFEEDI